MNNEPAFPMHGTSNTEAQVGMTLLDYIAIEAMKEYMRSTLCGTPKSFTPNWTSKTPLIVKDSYDMAEAMMEERKRRNNMES